MFHFTEYLHAPSFGVSRLGPGLLAVALFLGGSLLVQPAAAGTGEDCSTACRASSASLNWTYTEAALKAEPRSTKRAASLNWAYAPSVSRAADIAEPSAPANGGAVADRLDSDTSGLSWAIADETNAYAEDSADAEGGAPAARSRLSWSTIGGTKPARAVSETEAAASDDSPALTWSTIPGTGPAVPAPGRIGEAGEGPTGLSWSTIGGTGPAVERDAPVDATRNEEEADQPIADSAAPSTEEAGQAEEAFVSARSRVHQRIARLTRTVEDLRGQVSELQRQMREVRLASGDL